MIYCIKKNNSFITKNSTITKDIHLAYFSFYRTPKIYDTFNKYKDDGFVITEYNKYDFYYYMKYHDINKEYNIDDKKIYQSNLDKLFKIKLFTQNRREGFYYAEVYQLAEMRNKEISDILNEKYNIKKTFLAGSYNKPSFMDSRYCALFVRNKATIEKRINYINKNSDNLIFVIRKMTSENFVKLINRTLIYMKSRGFSPSKFTTFVKNSILCNKEMEYLNYKRSLLFDHYN